MEHLNTETMYRDDGHSVWLSGALINTPRVSVLGLWSQCLAEWGFKTPRVSVPGRWSQCLAEWGIKTPTVSVLAGTAVVMQRLAKCDNRTLESMSGQ